jgi:hypothetical protein
MWVILSTSNDYYEDEKRLLKSEYIMLGHSVWTINTAMGMVTVMPYFSPLEMQTKWLALRNRVLCH